jgi:multiple sugar transport system substrate-binding protein
VGHTWGSAFAAVGLVAGLVACGDDEDARPTLNWYVTPEAPPPAGHQGPYGQPGIAERCSTDEYRIEAVILPQSASEQRIQLARRLAAEDSSIDLMSLDTPFTAEFADAGFLAPMPGELQTALEESSLGGAVAGARWQGELVAAPFSANVQVLWFRKSAAEAAGLDMAEPVTWDQIIDAAVDQGGTVGVQANRYEGYIVWVNALIQGAGGNILDDPEAGADANVVLDTPEATEAARVVQTLANSSAAQPDLSVSNEGTVLQPFTTDAGAFMLNWTFIYDNYSGDEALLEDLGWTRYPRTVPDQESRPPIGGTNIAVSAFSSDPELAYQAVECITSVEMQVYNALDTGAMPGNRAVYEEAELLAAYPEDLLALFQESLDAAGPRPPTPYWNTIVNALLGSWHPPSSVDPDSTPSSSNGFVQDVLNGEALT